MPSSVSSDWSGSVKESLRKRVEAALAEAAVEVREPRPLFDPNFPEQRAFIEDEGKFQVVLCTRRSGKSFAAALRLLRAAMSQPGSSSLYIALTRESAERILWNDVLKVINRKDQWNLGAKFNESKLCMTLPNGSRIYLLGADAKEEERQKLLGQKYVEVCIDEAASYSIDLNALVYNILKPAVADYRGVICLIGTPGNLKTGLFYELTQGQDPRAPGTWEKIGWKGHRWSAFQNPHMAAKWREEIAELSAANPLIEQTPGFQQNYYGIWVIDDSMLVYRYAIGRNDYDKLPEVYGRGDWHAVLSIDLGFNDACAFTVLKYHDASRVLYIAESTKKSGLDITATSEYADEIKSRHDIEQTVIDGSNKQAVEELNRRHGLKAEPADKREKFDFIDIMNAEFIQGRIRLSPQCEALKEEYVELIVDERALKKGKRVEHPGCANHAADTGLYGWRKCWQYLHVPPPPPGPSRGTVEYVAQQQAEQLKQIDDEFEAELAANLKQQQEQMEMDTWS